jgi:hypothetical protein
MCVGNVQVHTSSVELVICDSHHGQLNCSLCYCLHAAGVIFTKPVEFVNPCAYKASYISMSYHVTAYSFTFEVTVCLNSTENFSPSLIINRMRDYKRLTGEFG